MNIKPNKSNKSPAIVADDSPLSAQLNSLVKDSADVGNYSNYQKITSDQFKNIVESTMDTISSNKAIISLFPDIEIAIQILVSSISSPNDFANAKLSYKNKSRVIPPDINIEYMKIVEDTMKELYDLENATDSILTELLFTSGATAYAIIPESIVNTVIDNGFVTKDTIGMEEFNNSHQFELPKILGDGKVHVNKVSVSLEDRIATEELTIDEDDLGISVTDDWRQIMYPSVLEERAERTTGDIYKLSTSLEARRRKVDTSVKKPDKKESKANLNIDKLIGNPEAIDKLYSITDKPQFNKSKDYIEFPSYSDIDRDTIGNPLVVKLPPESIIPVHMKNDVSKHMGYFILLDNEGLPMSTKENWRKEVHNAYNLTDKVNMNGRNQASDFVKRTSDTLHKSTSAAPTIDNVGYIYGKLVDSVIKKKLATGKLTSLVTIGDESELYGTMLARKLKNQKTNIVFLPKDLVQYYAFRYRPNGTGETLLERVSVLSSIRSILLFARLIGQVKSSIPVTNIRGEIDERDTDPRKTREMIISATLNNRQNQLPLGINNVQDLAEWGKSIGYRFDIKHKDLPNIDIQRSDESNDIHLPDTYLEESLEKRTLMSLSLPPKLVEDGFDSRFATSAIMNNKLFAKRSHKDQMRYNKLVSEHVKKLVLANGKLTKILRDKLTKKVSKIRNDYKKEHPDVDIDRLDDDSFIEHVMRHFINRIEVTLPETVHHGDNNLKDAFEEYEKMVETALNVYFSNEAIGADTNSELAEMVEKTKDGLKNVILRQWLDDNDYLPILSNALRTDDLGKPKEDLFERYGSHIEDVAEVLAPFIKSNNTRAKKLSKKLVDSGDIDEDSSKSPDRIVEDGVDDMNNDDAGDDNDTGADDVDDGDTPDDGGDAGEDVEPDDGGEDDTDDEEDKDE